MKFPGGRLIQFARAPVAGRVKTRIAAELGNQVALELHCQMVTRTYLTLLQSQLASVEIHVGGDPDHAFFMELCQGDDTLLVPQSGIDLGERMLNTFRQVLTVSDYAVLVGSDCPVIDPDYLESAFDALAAGKDVVLGPAEDGGYVLIGMRRLYPALFTGMEWGVDSVLSSTRARLQELGCVWHELAALWDVDRAADLKRFKALDC